MSPVEIRLRLEKSIREAGSILLSHYNKVLTYYTKSDGSFATQADLESEEFLVSALKGIVPGAGFYAEESGIIQGNEYTWVIDPLDGTTNFSRGIPYFCISVALTYQDERIIGAIYQPLTNEFFYAHKSGGATLNGHSLSLKNNKLENSVIGCGLSYRGKSCTADSLTLLASKVHSIRVLGAAALDIAYCASSRFDGIIFDGLSWWDIAAGSLILEQAGGKVSTISGEKLITGSTSFLGGSELMYENFENLLKKENRNC